jgi:peptidoglycan/LPS O-acetylase OafA/YrhL
MTRPPGDRYHALDALRGFAMLLGVLLHAAVPYTTIPIPFWPVQDARGTLGIDLFLFAVHDFRMQVFFLLAGFFGALLYSRYGLLGTATHRLRRIALPLALAMVTIQPLVQAVFVFAATSTGRVPVTGAQASPLLESARASGETPGRLTVVYFTTGEFLKHMIPVHMWFLWYLLLCFVVMLPLARLADRLRDRPAGRRWDGTARWLLTSRWRWPVLAAATYPLLLLMAMPVGPDTPLGWKPLGHLLAYYFVFFALGWTLYRHRDLFNRFARGWLGALLFANLLVLPTALGLLGSLPNPAQAGALAYPLHAVLGLYTWLMVGGLIGLFLRVLSTERAWVRWLADSAYWCYLASLPPVIVFQFLVVDWEVPAVVKFLVVSAATTALVLTTYWLFVRYTWVGGLLNGPRERPGRPPGTNSVGSVRLPLPGFVSRPAGPRQDSPS